MSGTVDVVCPALRDQNKLLEEQNSLLKEQNKILLRQIEQQGRMIETYRLIADILRARLR